MKFADIYNPALIRERTEAARGPVEPAETTKAQELADLIENLNFGCQRDNVRQLVAALIGEEQLPKPSTKNRPLFPVGALVIFNRKCVLITSIDSDGDAQFVTANGAHEVDGSSYIDNDVDEWKVASLYQVNSFLRNAGYAA